MANQDETEAPDDLHDFERSTFTHAGKERDVYRIGSGPCVVVMAEIPGITPKVAEFARRVAGLGLTATLPVLFGTPGRPGFKAGGRPDIGYVLSSIAPACVSKEFAAFATGRTAPVIDWLRALAKAEFERCGGPGVGAVGMCFTGGFALGMMADEHMLAPVLSQPSLPIGMTKKVARSVHLSPADLKIVKERADAGVCVLGLRFTGDKLSPHARFATLERELGDRFIGVEIDSSKGNPFGHRGAAHSVLTEDLVDEPGQPTHDALNQVLDFFRDRLLV